MREKEPGLSALLDGDKPTSFTVGANQQTWKERGKKVPLGQLVDLGRGFKEKRQKQHLFPWAWEVLRKT